MQTASMILAVHQQYLNSITKNRYQTNKNVNIEDIQNLNYLIEMLDKIKLSIL